MSSFHYELTTTASPEAAIAYLSDLTHFPEHVSEISSAERSGDGYTVTLGRFALPDVEFDYHVAATDTTVTATGTTHSMDVVDTWTVRPSGSGSEVAYVGSFELKGLTKLGGPMAQVFGQSRAPELAKSLKARLDALPAGESSS